VLVLQTKGRAGECFVLQKGRFTRKWAVRSPMNSHRPALFLVILPLPITRKRAATN
jgi:hypothetical protein